MSTETNAQIPQTHPHPPSVDELHATAHRTMQASKTHAIQAAEELRVALENKGRELLHAADDKAHELKARAETALDDAKTRAKSFQREAETYVRENPLTSMAIALGAGFVLGLLSRR